MKKPERMERDGVRGWLHAPEGRPVGATALTHGAGGDCGSALLVAVAEALAGAGQCVLRYDLPYRQARPRGSPGGVREQQRDRDGIRLVAAALREQAPEAPLYLAGQSYGGRQSSMLAAEDSSLAAALLMLSYPLHPPGQPARRRVEHFPAITMPVLFVHGTRDAFGSIEELEEARTLIPARTSILIVSGAPHGVPPKTAPQIAQRFTSFLKGEDG